MTELTTFDPIEMITEIEDAQELLREVSIEVVRLRAALEAIAAEASVKVGDNWRMYQGWRAIAVCRIDIARAALKGEA